MLLVKRVEGKIKYNLQYIDENVTENNRTILAPKINQPQLMNFEKWKIKYRDDIDFILTHYLKTFHRMSDEKYLIKIDTQNVITDLEKWIYESSSNRYK